MTQLEFSPDGAHQALGALLGNAEDNRSVHFRQRPQLNPECLGPGFRDKVAVLAAHLERIHAQGGEHLSSLAVLAQRADRQISEFERADEGFAGELQGRK